MYTTENSFCPTSLARCIDRRRHMGWTLGVVSKICVLSICCVSTREVCGLIIFNLFWLLNSRVDPPSDFLSRTLLIILFLKSL